MSRPPAHWLTCTRLTRRLFPLAAGALLARDRAPEVRRQRCSAAGALLDALKQTLGGTLTYSRLVDDGSRAAVLEQVRTPAPRQTPHWAGDRQQSQQIQPVTSPAELSLFTTRFWNI